MVSTAMTTGAQLMNKQSENKAAVTNELAEDELSFHELEKVSGGDDKVDHPLPQSVHINYGSLSGNENPGRLC
jgi:hypothetical protein